MFRNTKLALAAAGAVYLSACATLPPPALTTDHPAHPQAQPAPLASLPSALSTYRQGATAGPFAAYLDPKLREGKPDAIERSDFEQAKTDSPEAAASDPNISPAVVPGVTTSTRAPCVEL